MLTPQVCLLSDLLAAGMSATTIRRRFHRILPGVFCQEEPTWFDRCMAVTLWRPDALLSHRTAARLYGWIDEPTTVEALVDASTRLRPPGWLTLRGRTQGACDEVLGLPVTTREQTLIDCAVVLTADATYTSAKSSPPTAGAVTRRVSGDPSAAARSLPSCSASSSPFSQTRRAALTVFSAVECARS